MSDIVVATCSRKQKANKTQEKTDMGKKKPKPQK